MSSNGKHNSTPDSGIPQADSIATAMESINTLALWLKDAGLDESAIAHWKFNALAKKFPDLADIIEDAKKLISSGVALPEVGMTVTELASRLSEDLEMKIKPAQVNKALVELGLQVRPDNGKRIWQLTEEGKEYGFSRLATSVTNDWSGPQVTWRDSVLPLLVDYFESIDEEKSVGREGEETSGASPLNIPTHKDSTSPGLPESEPESKSWMISDRIKAIKRLSPSPRLKSLINGTERLRLSFTHRYKQSGKASLPFTRGYKSSDLNPAQACLCNSCKNLSEGLRPSTLQFPVVLRRENSVYSVQRLISLFVFSVRSLKCLFFRQNDSVRNQRVAK